MKNWVFAVWRVVSAMASRRASHGWPRPAVEPSMATSRASHGRPRPAIGPAMDSSRAGRRASHGRVGHWLIGNTFFLCVGSPGLHVGLLALRIEVDGDWPSGLGIWIAEAIPFLAVIPFVWAIVTPLDAVAAAAGRIGRIAVWRPFTGCYQ